MIHKSAKTGQSASDYLSIPAPSGYITAMPDYATPNLPSRDFAATCAFYAQLGFECQYQDGGWMILARGEVELEFFPYPDLDPGKSAFGCCIRLDDLAAIMEQLAKSNITPSAQGIPRFSHPRREASGITIAYLNDLDGSLIRLIQND